MNEAKKKREIISLALMLDEVSDYAVFFEYSPHVKQISIRVRESKTEWKGKIFDGSFYWDREGDEEYLLVKDFLEEEIRKATEII